MTAPVVVYGPQSLNAAPDSDTVRLALRLGWYMAELRGRYWWQGPRPSVTQLPVDPPHALPLRPERGEAESRHQTCETVDALALRLGVAAPFDPAEPFAPFDPTAQDGTSGSGRFAVRLAAVVAPLEAEGHLLSAVDRASPEAEKRDDAWAPVAALLHDWDAAIQDGFAARADALANAYLLGRGLAECYWALGPDDPAPGSLQEGTTVASDWEFLLGDGRRRELSRLVGRVGAHVNALTPSAVAGSIEAWGAVAKDPGWRAAPDSRSKLYEQLRRWYELLVLGRDPTTYVRPYAVLRGWRTTRHAFRALWPQLATALLSAAALGVLVWFLTTHHGTAALNVVLGLAGGLGLTAATVVAKAKSASQRLIARLRQDAYSDLVAVQMASIPAYPGEPEATTARRTRDAVTHRDLTPVTPLLDAPVVAV
ncbi:MAG: hypothetical protein JWO98_1868 [Frankiales bacterium]|nr:hypothetical protein [Frankiales bacterium]